MSQNRSIFRTPGEVHFGVGAVASVGRIAKTWGERALIITGARSAKATGALDAVCQSLKAAGVSVVIYDKVGHEPTIRLVEEARALARSERCDLMIGLGGGSPIDTAKCAAGLFYSPEAVAAHFRDGVEPPDQVLPWIAIPTTAGAGAEATPNSVLIDEETKIKQSLRSWRWLAKAAIVDPQLTVSCPPTVTAYSGMDAFTQAVESYVSRHATPLTEAISFEAALQVAKGLTRAYENVEVLYDLHGEQISYRNVLKGKWYIGEYAKTTIPLSRELAGPVHFQFRVNAVLSGARPYTYTDRLTFSFEERFEFGTSGAGAKSQASAIV